MVIEFGIPKQDVKNSNFHTVPITQVRIPNQIKQVQLNCLYDSMLGSKTFIPQVQ